MSERFRALVLDREDGNTRSRIEDLPLDALPEGEVLVEVVYSSLNYKDGLAITGAGKIIREFPFVPGIDLAGRVRESTVPGYRPGDLVVLTGWGVGERHWGGLAELARVRAEWLVPLPEGLSLEHAMTIGTAGFTAMLCVMALAEQGVGADAGDVLVTGASGGVGSIATALLARRGYRVVTATGRSELAEYLQGLGAAEVIDRASVLESGKAPLASQRWAGAVDTVGGAILAALLKALRYGGTATACGLAGGAELHTTVFPFILRGVKLIGIDSVYCPQERRRTVWQQLARELDAALLDQITTVVPLEKAPEIARGFLEGKIRGRVVVAIRDEH